MKKIIKIFGLTIVAIIALFLNTTSVNNSKSKLDLASLAIMNVANAEGTTCYGSYSFTGNWVIVKCNGCSQVAHVLAYTDKSTCNN